MVNTSAANNIIMIATSKSLDKVSLLVWKAASSTTTNNVRQCRSLSVQSLSSRTRNNDGSTIFSYQFSKRQHKDWSSPDHHRHRRRNHSHYHNFCQMNRQMSTTKAAQQKQNLRTNAPQHDSGILFSSLEPLHRISSSSRLSIQQQEGGGEEAQQSSNQTQKKKTLIPVSHHAIHNNNTVRFSSSATNSSSNYESDLIVVLDMDECLIHSQFLQPKIPHNGSKTKNNKNDYRQHELERDEYEYQKEISENDVDLVVEEGERCDYFQFGLSSMRKDEEEVKEIVHVNKRPHLDYFLKEVTNRFDTYIFTAAMKVYAQPLLNNFAKELIPEQKRFYRESCVFDENLSVYVKDLHQVFSSTSSEEEMNKKRIVLVDNNPLSFLANPSNGILVSNFYDDPRDETLIAVLDLLHELEPVDDVRPVLDEKFGLRSALTDVISKSPIYNNVKNRK